MRVIFKFAIVNQFGLKTRQKGREDRNSELMNWMKYRNHPVLDHRHFFYALAAFKEDFA